MAPGIGRLVTLSLVLASERSCVVDVQGRAGVVEIEPWEVKLWFRSCAPRAPSARVTRWTGYPYLRQWHVVSD